MVPLGSVGPMGLPASNQSSIIDRIAGLRVRRCRIDVANQEDAFWLPIRVHQQSYDLGCSCRIRSIRNRSQSGQSGIDLNPALQLQLLLQLQLQPQLQLQLQCRIEINAGLTGLTLD